MRSESVPSSENFSAEDSIFLCGMELDRSPSSRPRPRLSCPAPEVRTKAALPLNTQDIYKAACRKALRAPDRNCQPAPAAWQIRGGREQTAAREEKIHARRNNAATLYKPMHRQR